MSGVFQAAVSAVENGRVVEVNDQILNTIEALGEDTDEFLEMHERYVQRKKRELFQKAKGRS